MQAETPDETSSRSLDEARSTVRTVGIFAGPLLALVAYLLLPDSYLGTDGQAVSFGHAGKVTAAGAVWMAVWWMTEAIPIYATALLPLALFPAVGGMSMRTTAEAYGHELIFLFMGGFILALAMERWGLHRRIAFSALSLVGTRATRIVGGFMVVAAGLSMWISNTATTIMMMPVAVSVIGMSRPDAEERKGPSGRFDVCLLLGIAYAASIGGIGTLIGTAPNLFLASFLYNQTGEEITFVRWMGVGLPLVVVFLPIVWWLLTHVVYPPEFERIEGGPAMVREEYAALGRMGRGEWATLTVFACAVSGWLFRPLLARIDLSGLQPFAGLTDPGVAMIAALALFLIPVDARRRVFVMNWRTAVRLPWGLLLLFGGGLSLAAAIKTNGVGELIVSRVGTLAGLPTLAIVVVVAAVMIFLTELTSNTATTATLVPILFAVASGLGLDPLLLVVPATVGATCAFMLPVATPPNAIVFGTGLVTIPQMCRAGFLLNLIAIVLVTCLAYAVALPLLG